MDDESFGGWLKSRVTNLMDGVLVFFILGATGCLAALAAGAVLLPLGLGWEALNPELAGTGNEPVAIYVIAGLVFVVTWTAAAGHVFAANGLRGFSSRRS